VENSEAAANVRRRLDHLGRSPNANTCASLHSEGARCCPITTARPPASAEKDGKILVMMPGPGSEMRPMFIEQVLPRLEARDIALINEAYLQLRTCGLTDSEVEALLGPVFEPYGKRIYLGYSSQAGMVDVRIGAADEALSWKDIEMLGDTCREVLGADFVGYGDANIAEIIARQLRARGKTVGVAESITGGLICGMFTGIPGVSKVFRGGVVCYNNDIKESCWTSRATAPAARGL
jgi:nicotinamide-nucleotide amidase